MVVGLQLIIGWKMNWRYYGYRFSTRLTQGDKHASLSKLKVKGARPIYCKQKLGGQAPGGPTNGGYDGLKNPAINLTPISGKFCLGPRDAHDPPGIQGWLIRDDDPRRDYDLNCPLFPVPPAAVFQPTLRGA